MDKMEIPDTDSPEVMEQVVSLWITDQIWDQVSRLLHDDELEEKLTTLYNRVYNSVKRTHAGKDLANGAHFDPRLAGCFRGHQTISGPSRA